MHYADLRSLAVFACTDMRYSNTKHTRMYVYRSYHKNFGSELGMLDEI